MTTTPTVSLEKIRRQIETTERYQRDNPDWPGTESILKILRERERALSNQIQVEILKAAIDGVDNPQFVPADEA